jgi:hypothetical protein
LVEECVTPEGLVHDARPDYFPVYGVTKRSIDTMHMARELSAALRSRVNYAGLVGFEVIRCLLLPLKVAKGANSHCTATLSFKQPRFHSWEATA